MSFIPKDIEPFPVNIIDGPYKGKAGTAVNQYSDGVFGIDAQDGTRAFAKEEQLRRFVREGKEMTKKNQDSQKSLDGQSRPTLNQAVWHDSIGKTHHSLKIREILDALIVKYGRQAKVKDVIDQIYNEAYAAYEVKEC